MTQDEIKELLAPIEKRYEEVRAKLKSINEAMAKPIPEPRVEMQFENLMGQLHAYQYVITELLSRQLNIAKAECNLEIEKNEKKTQEVMKFHEENKLINS